MGNCVSHLGNVVLNSQCVAPINLSVTSSSKELHNTTATHELLRSKKSTTAISVPPDTTNVDCTYLLTGEVTDGTTIARAKQESVPCTNTFPCSPKSLFLPNSYRDGNDDDDDDSVSLPKKDTSAAPLKLSWPKKLPSFPAVAS